MSKYEQARSLSNKTEYHLRKGEIIAAYEKLTRLQAYIIEWDDAEKGYPPAQDET